MLDTPRNGTWPRPVPAGSVFWPIPDHTNAPRYSKLQPAAASFTLDAACGWQCCPKHPPAHAPHFHCQILHRPRPHRPWEPALPDSSPPETLGTGTEWTLQTSLLPGPCTEAGTGRLAQPRHPLSPHPARACRKWQCVWGVGWDRGQELGFLFLPLRSQREPGV